MPKKITHEEFIEKLKIIKPHIEVLTQYNGNKNYITIKCTVHNHTWQSKPNWLMHVGKCDCQKCYDERRGVSTKNGLNFFIEKGNGLFNNKYDYSKVVYVNNKTKIIITCPEHGEFQTTPEKHLNRKQGCPKCANKNVTTEEFVEKAKLIHGDKYDYSRVLYKTNSDEIVIGCKTHGYFKTTPDVHLRGCNCPKCVGLYKTTSEYISEAILVHGNKYDYSNVNYINTDNKICIICPDHGEFWQNPRNHLSGCGCSICKESRLEHLIRLLFYNNNLSFTYQYKIDWLGKQSLDFYLPYYNIAIECQGIQHFEPITFFGGENGLKNCIKRDITKNQLCSDNGIKLIYVTNCVNLLDNIFKNEIFLDIYNKDNIICATNNEIEKLLLKKIML